MHVLDESYPAHAYCFHIPTIDAVAHIADDVYRIIEYFWANIVPHNLFWTFGVTTDGRRQTMKIFIFPRMEMHDKTSVASMNVAFCELSGYVVVGGESYKVVVAQFNHRHHHYVLCLFLQCLRLGEAEYDALTEPRIVSEISQSVGDAKTLDNDILQLFS